MPSNSIDSCARVRATVPFSTFGQINRPFSNRFANRHSPSPSHHSILIKSPRRPRKTNTCPENGLSLRTVCTCALRPVNPRRRSVNPAAIQTCVPVGSAIIGPSLPTLLGRIPDRPPLRPALAHALDRCQWCQRDSIRLPLLSAASPAATRSPTGLPSPEPKRLPSLRRRQTTQHDTVVANETPGSCSHRLPAPLATPTPLA